MTQMTDTMILRCALVCMVLHKRAPTYDKHDWSALQSIAVAMRHIIMLALENGLLDLSTIAERWQSYEDSVEHKDPRRIDAVKKAFELSAHARGVDIRKYTPKGSDHQLQEYSELAAHLFASSIGIEISIKTEQPMVARMWEETRTFLVASTMYIGRLTNDGIVDVLKVEDSTLQQYILAAPSFLHSLAQLARDNEPDQHTLH